MTQLWHHTTSDTAAKIMVEGFRDRPHYEFAGTAVGILNGVWVADYPLEVSDHNRPEYNIYDVNDHNRPESTSYVLVDGDLDRMAEYERIEELKSYREWCVPAELLNRWPRHVVDDPETIGDDAPGDAVPGTLSSRWEKGPMNLSAAERQAVLLLCAEIRTRLHRIEAAIASSDGPLAETALNGLDSISAELRGQFGLPPRDMT